MKRKEKSFKGPFPPILYGLDGVMQVFQCSRSRASRLVHGKIAGSVTREGHLIIVDTKEALSLFGIHQPERFII